MVVHRISRIYVSRAAIMRLRSIKEELYFRGVLMGKFAQELGIHRKNLSNYIYGRTAPNLDMYLRLGDIFKWDLSHDVNYAYATQKYPLEETIRRIRRLGFKNWGQFAAAIKYTQVYVLRHVYEYSGVVGGLMPYATGLYYISREEHRLGYSDALDLED